MCGIVGCIIVHFLPLPELEDIVRRMTFQVPTCLVSRMTRGYVTVVLSSDGGDEFFSDYTRYNELKVKNGKKKWLLRQVLYRYVPRELIERPKMGFGAPIGQWLQGPLRGWAENLLAEDRLRKKAYLIPEAVRCLWTEHLSGRCNHQYVLWNILMFQAWLEIWG